MLAVMEKKSYSRIYEELQESERLWSRGRPNREEAHFYMIEFSHSIPYDNAQEMEFPQRSHQASCGSDFRQKYRCLEFSAPAQYLIVEKVVGPFEN